MPRYQRDLMIIFILILGYLLIDSNYIEVNTFGPSANASIKLTEKVQQIISQDPIQKNKAKQSKTAHELNEKDIYCLLADKNPSITMSGNLKIQYVQVSDHPRAHPEDVGLNVYVESTNCPAGKHSVVKFSQDGNIKNELDCQFATMEELVKQSHVVQFNIDFADSKVNEYNFAFNGPGHFLVLCPQSGFEMTRQGRFKRIESGLLENAQGCFLFNDADRNNPQGGPIILNSGNEPVDNLGCFKKSQQCIAQVDIYSPEIKEMTYKDPHHLGIVFEGYPKQISSKVRGTLFSGAIERLGDEVRGPTGLMNWKNISNLQFPIDCNKN